MATDRLAFPTVSGPILIGGKNVQTFKVGATAVKAGQVVSISAAGATRTVIPCVAEAGCQPVGVAIEAGAIGQQVSVACIGCIARVSNYSSDVDIDCGHFVTMNDALTPNGGTVIAVLAGATTVTQELVGVMVEDSTAASLTLDAMLVLCGATFAHHA
jgi:hypothetical protein